MPHYADVVKKFILNLHVDNSTNNFDTIGTAAEFCEKSKSCLRESNFELQKLAINNFKLKKFINLNGSNSRSKMDISDDGTHQGNLYGSCGIY